MFRAAMWFLILLAAAGCGRETAEPTTAAAPAAIPTAAATASATPSPTPVPPPTAIPSPAPTPTPAFAPSASILPTVAPAPVAADRTPVSVERKLDRIELRTETIRGLRASGETGRELAGADEVRAILAADLAEDADGIALAGRLYALLGIIGRGDDLRGALAAAHGDITPGLFRADADTLHVAAGEGGRLTPRSEMAAAHGFVHALQQAHFDIEGLRRSLAGDSDRLAALMALAEGDATLAEELYYLNVFDESQQDAADAESGGASMSAFFAAPTFIRRTIAFPYVEGRRFAVILFFENNDFSAVNAAYSALPSSTEQIIHPEKYGLDEPVEVALGDLAGALGEGWAELDRDVMGELFFRSMLEGQTGTVRSAGEAAAGWGGDRYALLESPDGAFALASASVWDTAEDAVDMGIALRNYFSLSTGAILWKDVSPSGAATTTLLLEADGGTVAELRVDPAARRIRLIAAESAGAAAAVSAAMGDWD